MTTARRHLRNSNEEQQGGADMLGMIRIYLCPCLVWNRLHQEQQGEAAAPPCGDS